MKMRAQTTSDATLARVVSLCDCCHFVEFEHWLAGDADVEARDLESGLLTRLPQALDRGPVEFLAWGLGGDEVDPAFGEGDVDLSLGVLAGAEQGVNTRGGGTPARCRLRGTPANNALQRGQRLDHATCSRRSPPAWRCGTAC